jgi:ABC-type dipeptide/oligopeptide/nickel transport system permease component
MLQIALQLLLRRFVLAVPILLCVSALVFVILRLLPADPIAMSLPPGATPADYARLRADFGLDKPLLVQYGVWLRKVLSGDLGISIFFRRDVLGLLMQALPATLELVACGMWVGIILGMGGGLAMFAARGTLVEGVLDFSTSAVMAVPEFLWAILLIVVLGVALPVLPFIGRLDPGLTVPVHKTGFLLLDSVLTGNGAALRSALVHLILPTAALAIGLAPLIMRVLRASLFEAIHEDYITQARLRGIGERAIILRHALKNAVLPTLSLIGVQGGFMFGGTVLVEMIFAYPGLGNLMIDAVRNHDLPVIQATALVYCVLVLGINATVDVLYLIANPKLRTA